MAVHAPPQRPPAGEGPHHAAAAARLRPRLRRRDGRRLRQARRPRRRRPRGGRAAVGVGGGTCCTATSGRSTPPTPRPRCGTGSNGSGATFGEARAALRAEVTGKAPFRRDTAPLRTTYDDTCSPWPSGGGACGGTSRGRSTRDVVDRAVRVAAYSPSACNRQPFSFRLFDDPAAVREIAGIAMGTRGFSDQFPGLGGAGWGGCGPTRTRGTGTSIYIDASLAAMAFQFALEVQGVGSCCINWPDVRDRDERIGRVMGLEPDERVVMLVSYGHPDPRRAGALLAEEEPGRDPQLQPPAAKPPRFPPKGATPSPEGEGVSGSKTVCPDTPSPFGRRCGTVFGGTTN